MMTERPQNQWDATVDPDAQIFVISVAAELAGMHAQTLRNYDRLGLGHPASNHRWRTTLLPA